MEQPFVFFHASLALQKIASQYGSTETGRIREVARQALEQVRSVRGKEPDRNTVSVLEEVLNRLDHLMP